MKRQVFYLPNGVQEARQMADKGLPVAISYGAPKWAQAADVPLYYGAFSEAETSWAHEIDFMTKTVGLLIGAFTWKVVEVEDPEPVTIVDITPDEAD